MERGSGAWASRVSRLARQGRNELARNGWFGLDDAVAGALLMCMRAGPVEEFMMQLTAAERQGRPMFPIMLMGASGGVPCRIQFEGLLPEGKPLRMAAFSPAQAVDATWETLLDLVATGAPGWHRDEECRSLPSVGATKLQACRELVGLEPAVVGAAFRPLMTTACMLGVDATILMCAVFDIRSRMLSMNAGVIEHELAGAHDEHRSYGNILGCAWSGALPIPPRDCDEGIPMTLEEASRPGARLETVHMVLENTSMGMQPTEVGFSGRLVH